MLKYSYRIILIILSVFLFESPVYAHDPEKTIIYAVGIGVMSLVVSSALAALIAFFFLRKRSKTTIVILVIIITLLLFVLLSWIAIGIFDRVTKGLDPW
jgi:cation transporter-like permease